MPGVHAEEEPGECDKNIRAPRVWMAYGRSATLAAANTKLRPVVDVNRFVKSPSDRVIKFPSLLQSRFADDTLLWSHSCQPRNPPEDGPSRIRLEDNPPCSIKP